MRERGRRRNEGDRKVKEMREKVDKEMRERGRRRNE